MIRYSVLLCLIGILAYFPDTIGACEAIVGGDLADIRKFPYQVSLLVHGKHICGGGIIDDKLILTAAHCVVQRNGLFKDNHITVLAGSHNVHKTGKPAISIEVRRVFIPKKYKPQPANTGGDIAILQLKDSLALWRHRQLKKLELPKNIHETYTGKTVMIAGFGWNSIQVHHHEEQCGRSDGQLRFAEADVISTSECQGGYEKRKILDIQICARVKQGDFPRGVCTGDSGDPLVYDEKTVIGVLSVSPIGCEEKTSAAIYTRVSDYLQFIENVMKNKESDDIRSITLIH